MKFLESFKNAFPYTKGEKGFILLSADYDNGRGVDAHDYIRRADNRLLVISWLTGLGRPDNYDDLLESSVSDKDEFDDIKVRNHPGQNPLNQPCPRDQPSIMHSKSFLDDLLDYDEKLHNQCRVEGRRHYSGLFCLSANRPQWWMEKHPKPQTWEQIAKISNKYCPQGSWRSHKKWREWGRWSGTDSVRWEVTEGAGED